MRLTDLIDLFVDSVCAGKTNETPTAYRSKLNHLEKYIDHLPGQADVDAFKKYLLTRKTHHRGKKEVPGPLSKFTIRSILATTRHFLSWSHEHGYLPAIQLTNITEPPADPKAVDGETITRMLLAVPRVGQPWEQTRNLAIMYVLIDTGSRVGCVARMEVQNLDMESGWCQSMDKGDHWSWLWFNAPTLEAIRAWLQIRYHQNPMDDRIWTGSNQTGMTRQGIYRMLNRLASAAGVEHYRHNPHSFRHSFAREAILAGASLNAVAEMLNHRGGIVVTHKYYARWEKTKEVKQFHTRFSPGRNLPQAE